MGNKNIHKSSIKELHISKTCIKHLIYTSPCPEVAKGPLSDTDSKVLRTWAMILSFQKETSASKLNYRKHLPIGPKGFLARNCLLAQK